VSHQQRLLSCHHQQSHPQFPLLVLSQLVVLDLCLQQLSQTAQLSLAPSPVQLPALLTQVLKPLPLQLCPHTLSQAHSLLSLPQPSQFLLWPPLYHHPSSHLLHHPPHSPPLPHLNPLKLLRLRLPLHHPLPAQYHLHHPQLCHLHHHQPQKPPHPLLLFPRLLHLPSCPHPHPLCQ